MQQLSIQKQPKEPKGLAQLSTLTHFVSISFFISLVNTAFYESIFFVNREELKLTMSFNSYLYLIESLKSILPIFLGFIFDHLQYKLNILNILLAFNILSQFFFVCFILKDLTEETTPAIYFYISLSFQTISQQCQMIYSTTTIAKIHDYHQILKQFCLLFRYFFLGKASGIIFAFLNPDKLSFSIIISIFFLFTIIIIAISCIFFKSISYYVLSKHFFLKIQSPDEELGFWDSLKRSFQCNNLLIILTGALTICISYSYFDNQYYYLKLYFEINHQDIGFYSQVIKSCAYLAGAIILFYLEYGFRSCRRMLRSLKLSSNVTIISSLLIYLLANFVNGKMFVVFQIYIIISLFMIYALSGRYTLYQNINQNQQSFLTTTIMLAENQDFLQSIGTIYGTLFMILNLLILWLMTSWIKSNNQIQVLIIYSLAFSISSNILCRLMTWLEEKNRTRTKEELRRGYETIKESKSLGGLQENCSNQTRKESLVELTT